MVGETFWRSAADKGQKGDETMALEYDPGDLAGRYGPAVYRLAFARTGSRADAEDVMQETFLRLVRRRPELESEEHAKAWLLRVALGCVADLYRTPWRRHDLPLSEDLPAPEPAEGGVLEAVLALPEKYRVPVHLYYYEELTTAQIARVMGKKEATVRTWLRRGRLLSQMLKGGAGDVEAGI